MRNWHLISTAPKDGSRVLLFRASAERSLHIVIGRWTEDERTQGHKPYWTHDAEHRHGIKEARRFQPTHWMPLPEQPAVPLMNEHHSIDDLRHAGHAKHYRQR